MSGRQLPFMAAGTLPGKERQIERMFAMNTDYGPDPDDPLDPVNVFGHEPEVIEVLGYDNVNDLNTADRLFIESLTSKQKAGLSRLLYRLADRDEEYDNEDQKAGFRLAITWLLTGDPLIEAFLPCLPGLLTEVSNEISVHRMNKKKGKAS
jgi:hypothetical protein